MDRVATAIEGVSRCPCGDHPVLVLTALSGAGSVIVGLRPEEADRLEREFTGRPPPSDSPGLPLARAMDATGWTLAGVRLSSGNDHALVGLIEIVAGDDRADVELGAADAVALAWRGGLPVEVPGELVRPTPVSAID